MTTEKEVAADLTLRDLYYDPAIGYQSKERLYQDARAAGLSVSRKKVAEWPAHQNTFTRFAKTSKTFKRRQTYVPGLKMQMQADLIDLLAFEDQNDGYKLSLNAVDCFSRYGFAIPVRRKFAKFMKPAMKTLLDEYVKVYGGYPEVIQFDLGTEFHNTQVNPLLDSLGIRHFSTRPTSKKASIVERWDKEMKKLMFRYFHKAGDERWIDVLQDLVQNVNSKVNRSIGMNPDEVSEENSYLVFAKLYGKALPFEKPKYSVGHRVRLSEYASPLLSPNKKTLVKERDIVKGKFYENELSLAQEPQK